MHILHYSVPVLSSQLQQSAFFKISEMKKACKNTKSRIDYWVEYVLSMIDERTTCHVTEGMCYTINQEQVTRP